MSDWNTLWHLACSRSFPEYSCMYLMALGQMFCFLFFQFFLQILKDCILACVYCFFLKEGHLKTSYAEEV